MSGGTVTDTAPNLPNEPQARHVVYCGGAELMNTHLSPFPLLMLETSSLHLAP